MTIEGQARIVNGKLEIYHAGNFQAWGIRHVRAAVKQMEASKSDLKASTYATLCAYRAAIKLWEARAA